MSDIWIRRRRFGSAQCSIAEAASARNFLLIYLSALSSVEVSSPDERPGTNIGKYLSQPRSGLRIPTKHEISSHIGQRSIPRGPRPATSTRFPIDLRGDASSLAPAARRAGFLLPTREMLGRLRPKFLGMFP
ncbi:hypothetical protein EVAR_22916_1 [Eumeta japonica]|uniref:Uncharacterized protein n=1 Tax=Eumeta variegata TaxID=151549 RepID=A0A4C1UUA2_EUMVA|nr:hypothetical protein EVAR_22916_1 [Eumeta japonica]